MKTNKFKTYDAKMLTKDSQLAYYVNQLEAYDPKLYAPLVGITWGRDIKLRPGVSITNETTSFIRSAFASGGTMSSQGKPWIGGDSNALPGVTINGQKINTPIRALGREVSYTSIELKKSQQLSMSIDTQKVDALNTLYQMNTDEMVYVGDTDTGSKGLFNSSLVTAGSVAATGTGASTLWSSKTVAQILADINALLESTWAASAYTVMPRELRIPPLQYSALASTLVSSAGNMSVLKYLSENTIANEENGAPLNIKPSKWLVGAGASGTDRMVAYTNDVDRVRFPMVPIYRDTPYYMGIKFNAPYIWAYGEVEWVYPETAQYADGI